MAPLLVLRKEAPDDAAESPSLPSVAGSFDPSTSKAPDASAQSPSVAQRTPFDPSAIKHLMSQLHKEHLHLPRQWMTLGTRQGIVKVEANLKDTHQTWKPRWFLSGGPKHGRKRKVKEPPSFQFSSTAFDSETSQIGHVVG